MQLVFGTDTDQLSAWYVGGQVWVLPWLSGRTVATEVASAAVCAAEILQRAPAANESSWDFVHASAALLGLTARDLAEALQIDCAVPVPPAVQPRRHLWLPAPQLLGDAR